MPKPDTEAKPCATWNPPHSELRPTSRCRDCGRLEHEHGTEAHPSMSTNETTPKSDTPRTDAVIIEGEIMGGFPHRVLATGRFWVEMETARALERECDALRKVLEGLLEGAEDVIGQYDEDFGALAEMENALEGMKQDIKAARQALAANKAAKDGEAG